MPGENEQFIQSLPESYRADPSFQSYKDMDGLLKSYKSMETMLGADKNLLFKLPKSGDYTEIYTKMGKPEKEDGYQLPKELKVPLSDALQKSLRSMAHKANLTQAQIEALVQFSDAEAFAGLEAAKTAAAKAKADAENAIKTEFGEAYSERMNHARNVFEAFGDTGKAALADIEKAGLLNSPALIGLLSDIGAMMGEDQLRDGGGGGSFRLSPEAAQAEIRTKQGDPAFMKKYTDGAHPEHKDAVAKMKELFATAYPGT